MTPKNKRYLVTGIIAVVLLILIVIGIRYIPFVIMFRAPSPAGIGFTDQQMNLNQAPNSYSCNFEIDPKTGSEKGLYKGIAHSGQYSAKAFGNNTYTIPVQRTAGQLGLENLKSVGVSAWIYIFPGTNDMDGVFVFSVTNTLGVTVCWKGKYLNGKDNPRGKWFKISGLFDLSEVKFQPDYKIQVYFWNRSHNDVLADDYYVVYSGSKERRGDSTYANMTTGRPFQSKFNYPPFPITFLQRGEIGNNGADGLVSEEKVTEGVILPEDKVLTGCFTGSGNLDDILVITPAGKAELFTFCTVKNEFRKVEVSIPAEAGDAFRSEQALSGSFTNPASAQLLLIGKTSILLGGFEKTGNSCSSKSGLKSSFHIIGKADIKSLTGSANVKGTLFKAGDFDGNKICELYTLSKEGAWKLFRWTGERNGSWSLQAGGDGDVKEWIHPEDEIGVTPGRFLANFSQDLLMTVFRDLKTRKFQYTLLKYDPASRHFLYCFPESQGHLGKITGLDTLKPGDQFFTPGAGIPGETGVYRYNRDWRFDLKKIIFNESTYEITESVDFTGYDMDHNPKYYEILRIFTGCFVKPNAPSFLVIARNKGNKSLPYLPNSIQIYSPGKSH
jgi:hypothetical protein